MNANIIFN